jgi:hypothetical protein
MPYKKLPIADILANDPDVVLIDDRRAASGCVLVACPNDDGVGEHVVFVHNPVASSVIRGRSQGPLPAHAYCLNDACKHMTTAMLLDIPLKSVLAGQKPHCLDDK